MPENQYYPLLQGAKDENKGIVGTWEVGVIDALRPMSNEPIVINFGSDSFLGLDQDPRVQEALRRGISKWGTHNGASRAFSSVRANIEAEEKLAAWLGTEAALI